MSLFGPSVVIAESCSGPVHCTLPNARLVPVATVTSDATTHTAMVAQDSRPWGWNSLNCVAAAKVQE